MAAPTPQTNPYTAPGAAAMATRNLVSTPISDKPTSLPTASLPSNTPTSLPTASPNGTRPTNIHPVSEALLMKYERGHTNLYERAAAEAAKTGTMPSTTAGGAAAVVGSEGVGGGKGYTMSDLKGQKQGEMVDAKASGGSGQGFSNDLETVEYL